MSLSNIVLKNELYHHGVRGMKWGVRRYQNEDGSLTPRGEARLRQLYNDKKQTDKRQKGTFFDPEVQRKRYNDSLAKAGIISGDKADLLKAGSTLTRFTDSKNENKTGAKYVSLTEDDQREYSNLAKSGYLGNSTNKSIYQITLKNTKPLTIAKGEELADYLISNFGTEGEKRQYAVSKRYEKELPGLKNMGTPSPKYSRNPLIYYRNKRLNAEVDKPIMDYVKSGYKNVRVVANRVQYKDKETSAKVFEHFKKKGYDAIIDVEDWRGIVFDSGSTDYPLIVLEPNKTLKTVQKKKI